MNKVDFPDLPPSVCFVCTQAASGIKYVDTTRNFTPPAPTPLSGRIYICEHCVQTAADALGLFDTFKIAVTEVQERAAIVEQQLHAFASIKNAVATIHAFNNSTGETETDEEDAEPDTSVIDAITDAVATIHTAIHTAAAETAEAIKDATAMPDPPKDVPQTETAPVETKTPATKGESKTSKS